MLKILGQLSDICIIVGLECSFDYFLFLCQIFIVVGGELVGLDVRVPRFGELLEKVLLRELILVSVT